MGSAVVAPAPQNLSVFMWSAAQVCELAGDFMKYDLSSQSALVCMSPAKFCTAAAKSGSFVGGSF